MAGRRNLVAGNWKMNGLAADGLALARAVAAHAAGGLPGGVDLLVCPPATLLRPVGDALAGMAVALGGQDCSAAPNGAHTGDVSAAMLRDAGCSYVILGHSERRQDHGETDAQVRAKVEAAHRAGLIAIVCVGETEAERDRGEAVDVVARQLQDSLPDGAGPADTVIAYEPVWAIGTGRTPTAADVAEMHAAIRARLAGRFAGGGDMRVLYGGSVKPANAAVFMSLADVDGALVGGASLNADDFWAIARSCH